MTNLHDFYPSQETIGLNHKALIMLKMISLLGTEQLATKEQMADIGWRKGKIPCHSLARLIDNNENN